MKINDDLLLQAESDLGMNLPFVKGRDIPVKNYWHFTTDGNSVDRIFDDKDDFIAGMNRIFVVSQNYRVIILAFCLMDTHLHFILYGEYDECNRFIHEYIKRTSMHISFIHGEKHKLRRISVNHQKIDNLHYLKVAICYVLKNPPVGGLRYSYIDYPWSSGPLYFRSDNTWSTPVWKLAIGKGENLSLTVREKRDILKINADIDTDKVLIIDNIIFPGEYVAVELVEKIFRTHKAFNLFLCISRDEYVESRGGAISRLSIPIQEMRQHRNEICQDIFKVNTIRMLNVEQRLRLARILRSRYNSSIKQVSRLCGLIPEEVKGLM